MTIRRDETATEDCLAQAAAWRVRLSEAGADSTPEFEAWLQIPDNQAAWHQLSCSWDYFDQIAQSPEILAARQAALADAHKTRSRFAARANMRLVGSIAALVLFAILGAGGYWWANKPADYQTAIGERRVVTLSDGSKLSLDTDSEVTVRYAPHTRSLHLLRGQARFDVAHDRSRPFSVVAGNQKVIATGTAFNIDMAGPKVLVTLIEGHVLVLQADSNVNMPDYGARVIELKAGQQLAAGTAAPPQVLPANVQRVTAWTIGQIVFDDEPLSSVVERVNRYGGTRIVIADPAVGAMKISGVFNAGDVVGFVGIVTHYLPVRAVSSDSSTIALESTAKKNRAL
ncbi:MAG TPA: FecR domain-containing protein [Rhizomicrobium sp.]|nr:FecR domain-containing protein [Rhizomicrobium sp.]